ncbi:helix-turn-helix domain-containing protein [Stutzerimonas stutzeri]|nr:helix-turn-helix domain-containing protein [Stutzerimonas stutzeri]
MARSEIAERPPLTVALLATPDSTASTLFGLYDLLLGTRRDWQQLMHRCDVASPFRPLIVSRDGGLLRVYNDIPVQPHASLTEAPPADVVIVSNLAVSPWEPLDERYAPEAQWLRERYAAGATLAAACSGAMLLAQTGLLAGCEGTSHWGYCDCLRREYPDVHWHPDKALVNTGIGQRLVMSGSGSSWHALGLFLIARFVGAREAMEVARLNLFDWDATSPLAYAAMMRTGQLADPIIARCQEWAAQHYEEEAPVSAMVRISGLPERTFQRRFALATGLTPLDYIHTLRLEEAKQLLESGELSVEAIAWEVGYQDAGFFGRLFRRKVGLTPAQYRRRFGVLSRRLAGIATLQEERAPALH